jgi:YHS domain-containing protein
MVTDPVCLKQLDETEATEKAVYREQTYYFDSARCREVFERSPEEFAGNLPILDYGDQGSRFLERK